jgi:hypothetical protein
VSAIDAQLAVLAARRQRRADKQREALLVRHAELAKQIRAARSQRLPRLLTEPEPDNCEPFERFMVGWRNYEWQRDAPGPYRPFASAWKAVGL